MDLKEVRELIRLVTERGITEFEIEREGFRLRIARPGETPVPVMPTAPVIIQTPVATAPEALQLAPATAPPTPAPTTAPPAAAPEPELHIIKSPIVGTFYRSPSPTAEPFVKIGHQIEPDTVVCIIEAMKLMNEIHAEAAGEIAKIFVENGQPVEYGQPLFGIKA